MKFNFLILPFRAADTSQPMFVVCAKYKEGRKESIKAKRSNRKEILECRNQ